MTALESCSVVERGVLSNNAQILYVGQLVVGEIVVRKMVRECFRT